MNLIDALLPRASNPTGGSAVVSAVNTDGTVDISVDGATVPAACLEGYALTEPPVTWCSSCPCAAATS
ncbi:hypothetical protein SRIMM317S_03974 [Streptomyces rimosus subsp. rimosus]